MADQKIIDKLVTARIALLLKHPFFGNLATRLKLINANNWCPTAGTDGRHFYYNTKFIDSLFIYFVTISLDGFNRINTKI